MLQNYHPKIGIKDSIKFLLLFCLRPIWILYLSYSGHFAACLQSIVNSQTSINDDKVDKRKNECVIVTLIKQAFEEKTYEYLFGCSNLPSKMSHVL